MQKWLHSGGFSAGGAFSLEDFDQRDHLRCAGKRRSAGIAFLKRPLHIRYSSHFRTSGWKRWNNWLGLLGSLRSSSSSSLRHYVWFIRFHTPTNSVKFTANHNSNTYNHSARLVEVMMICGVTLRRACPASLAFLAPGPLLGLSVDGSEIDRFDQDDAGICWICRLLAG